MADRIVTGRKYRIKAAENIWDLISFWTKASDVEMNDGTNLENSFSNLKSTSNQHTESISILNQNGNAVVESAPEYNSSKKYEKGDIVTYNDSEYYCNVEINSPEAWNSSHWTLITDTLPFKFGIDADGNYGYIKAGADSVTPFSKTSAIYLGTATNSGTFFLGDYGVKESKWSELTVNNFIVGSGGWTVHSGWYYVEGYNGVAAYSGVSKSYDPNTGILTVGAGGNISRGDDVVQATNIPIYATLVF